jgi:carbon-monoxide dehydrogenase medium subunit
VEEISRRPGDFALAGVVCVVERDDTGRCARAAIGLFGVASTPVRARGAEEVLVGEQPSHSVLDAAAAACFDDVEVQGDEVHASAAYRRTAGRALVRMALGKAVRSADGGTA